MRPAVAVAEVQMLSEDEERMLVGSVAVIQARPVAIITISIHSFISLTMQE